MKIIELLVCSLVIGGLSEISHAATLTYTYDSLHRITNAAYSDGSRESFSYDNAGNRLTQITHGATTNVDQIAPTIPTNLTSLSSSPSQLKLGWDRSSDTGGAGMAGYVIFVNSIPFVTNSVGTDFVMSRLLPNTEYCLSVASLDKSGNQSAPSQSQCLTTAPFVPPQLSIKGSFLNGIFEIQATNGTPGQYGVFVSTNLVTWERETNITLPISNSIPIASGINGVPQKFYQLRLITNGVTGSQ